MRNPWDYPPTDGFTDTYEYSKGLQDDLNYLQKGYMNKNITNLDDTPLIDEGIGDYLAGTESYAMRYFQGQLISNQIIGFNQINGSEGLLAAIGEKIKQFFKWLASIFTKEKNESIVKVTTATKPADTKSDQPLDVHKIEALMDTFKSMKLAWFTSSNLYKTGNEALIDGIKKLKEEFPQSYSGVENLDNHKFNQSIDHVTDHLNGLSDKIAELKTVDQLVNYSKSKHEMLWRAMIAVIDSRVKIAPLDVVKSLADSAYESAVKTRLSSITDEKDQKRVSDNLLALSRFSAKLVGIRNHTDVLARINRDISSGYYNQKA